MFYLTTHFIYAYVTLDVWLSTIQIMRKETCHYHFMEYSFWLIARDLSNVHHPADKSTCNLCYTSCGVLAVIRNNSIDPPGGISLAQTIRVAEPQWGKCPPDLRLVHVVSHGGVFIQILPCQ